MPYLIFENDNAPSGAGFGYRWVPDDYEGSDSSAGEVVVDAQPDLSVMVWDEQASSLRNRSAPEMLSHAKALKEAELRDQADSWYQGSVRAFEGAIVTAKYGRSGLTALNTEERAIFDEMNANYTKLKNLIGQVRAATTVAEVEGVAWTP